MKINIYQYLPIILLICGSALGTQPHFSNLAQEQKFYQLVRKFRCPTCPNQSIIDSESMIAKDLQKVVFKQIKQGKSNREIIDFMVSRYGDFIFYQPPINKKTIILWLGPLLILLVGLWTVIRFINFRRVIKNSS